MKNVFLGFGITLCSILFIVIIMTLSGTILRQNELNRAVDIAIEDTVENQFDSRSYSANSEQEFIADFMEALMVQINSKCTLKINILNVDYEKGLLSVEVVELYQHPIGTNGEVSVKRSVIMEQYTVPINEG